MKVIQEPSYGWMRMYHVFTLPNGMVIQDHSVEYGETYSASHTVITEPLALLEIDGKKFIVRESDEKYQDYLIYRKKHDTVVDPSTIPIGSIVLLDTGERCHWLGKGQHLVARPTFTMFEDWFGYCPSGVKIAPKIIHVFSEWKDPMEVESKLGTSTLTSWRYRYYDSSRRDIAGRIIRYDIHTVKLTEGGVIPIEPPALIGYESTIRVTPATIMTNGEERKHRLMYIHKAGVYGSP